MVDGQPVEAARNRLFLVQARRVVPRRDLGFDLRIIRPTIPNGIAVGAKGATARVGGTLDAPSDTNNHLPAPLAGRRFLLNPRDNGAPVHSGKVDLHV